MKTNRGSSAFALLVALFSVGVAASACKKDVKAGDACEKQGEIQCIDKQNGAFCVNGKYEVLACEGPTGCMMVAHPPQLPGG
jgi:hypothetical protein